MGRDRVRGWARRRLRGLLLQLPPFLRRAVARPGWRATQLFGVRRARERDADWAAAMIDPPLPPVHLRSLVGRPYDAQHFLATGKENADFVHGLLERNGLAPTGRVLDFGCGCGRLARWWPRDGYPVELYGCDPNAELVRWCQENLPFMAVVRNDELPPTAFPDGFFDLVYAFSIFTHLTTETQDAWIDELHRILRPGGTLFFTVNGGLRASLLPHRAMAAFVQGQPITLFEEAAGSNLCVAYRPAAYVEEHMLRRFQPLVAVPAGDGRSPIEQDSYIARKPSANAARHGERRRQFPVH